MLHQNWIIYRLGIKCKMKLNIKVLKITFKIKNRLKMVNLTIIVIIIKNIIQTEKEVKIKIWINIQIEEIIKTNIKVIQNLSWTHFVRQFIVKIVTKRIKFRDIKIVIIQIQIK